MRPRCGHARVIVGPASSVIACVVLFLSACGGDAADLGATTCDEFDQLSQSERDELAEAVLRDRDLDLMSVPEEIAYGPGGLASSRGTIALTLYCEDAANGSVTLEPATDEVVSEAEEAIRFAPR